MMRIAINGFGRIGRVTMRALLNNKNLEVVAINDLTNAATLSHLFKYDSVHRKFAGTIEHNDKQLIINGKPIAIYGEKDPSALPWKSLGVDVVLESTGKFVTEEGARLHLVAGARKVLISAPAKGDKTNITSVVMGVNDHVLTGKEQIISNASCTTNNIAPMIKILHENWGIVSGYITTVHAYTGDQNLHDAPHKDLRRARAAANSIIPTTTGAAKAITEIFPDLDGKLGGAGIRVPVLDGSVTDLTCVVEKPADADSINAAFKKAADGPMKGILEYTDEPIVSVDIIGNTHSCTFDSLLTSTIGNMVKTVGWYDNEMGYSSRLADLLEKLAKS